MGGNMQITVFLVKAASRTRWQ